MIGMADVQKVLDVHDHGKLTPERMEELDVDPHTITMLGIKIAAMTLECPLEDLGAPHLRTLATMIGAGASYAFAIGVECGRLEAS